jgi:hypothetical protein
MRFRDNFWFLSNIYNAPVIYNNIEYQNAEAAYQAQKQVLVDASISLDNFKIMKGIDAKRYANNNIKMSPEQIRHWNSIRDNVMYQIVKAKFSQNQYLKWRLLQTKDLNLIEENWWHDIYWGVCHGVGENKLGKILMQVRDELS